MGSEMCIRDREHYYTVLNSIQLGNDSFDQVQFIAMIDSGWTELGLYRSMIESLTSYVNQKLIENDMDEDIRLLLNPDQQSPKGCVEYNTSMYSDQAALARLIYPTITVTLQGGSTALIDLAETAALYGESEGLQIMCSNVMQMEDSDTIMLGTPFLIDRYTQLNPSEKKGYFTDIVECDQVKAALQSRSNLDGPDETANGSYQHTIWVAVFVAVLGQIAG